MRGFLAFAFGFLFGMLVLAAAIFAFAFAAAATFAAAFAFAFAFGVGAESRSAALRLGAISTRTLFDLAILGLGPDLPNENKTIQLNESVNIVLSSYTQSIHIRFKTKQCNHEIIFLFFLIMHQRLCLVLCPSAKFLQATTTKLFSCRSCTGNVLYCICPTATFWKGFKLRLYP